MSRYNRHRSASPRPERPDGKRYQSKRTAPITRSIPQEGPRFVSDRTDEELEAVMKSIFNRPSMWSRNPRANKEYSEAATVELNDLTEVGEEESSGESSVTSDTVVEPSAQPVARLVHAGEGKDNPFQRTEAVSMEENISAEHTPNRRFASWWYDRRNRGRTGVLQEAAGTSSKPKSDKAGAAYSALAGTGSAIQGLASAGSGLINATGTAINTLIRPDMFGNNVAEGLADTFNQSTGAISNLISGVQGVVDQAGVRHVLSQNKRFEQEFLELINKDRKRDNIRAAKTVYDLTDEELNRYQNYLHKKSTELTSREGWGKGTKTGAALEQAREDRGKIVPEITDIKEQKAKAALKMAEVNKDLWEQMRADAIERSDTYLDSYWKDTIFDGLDDVTKEYYIKKYGKDAKESRAARAEFMETRPTAMVDAIMDIDKRDIEDYLTTNSIDNTEENRLKAIAHIMSTKKDRSYFDTSLSQEQRGKFLEDLKKNYTRYDKATNSYEWTNGDMKKIYDEAYREKTAGDNFMASDHARAIQRDALVRSIGVDDAELIKDTVFGYELAELLQKNESFLIDVENHNGDILETLIDSKKYDDDLNRLIDAANTSRVKLLETLGVSPSEHTSDIERDIMLSGLSDVERDAYIKMYRVLKEHSTNLDLIKFNKGLKNTLYEGVRVGSTFGLNMDGTDASTSVATDLNGRPTYTGNIPSFIKTKGKKLTQNEYDDWAYKLDTALKETINSLKRSKLGIKGLDMYTMKFASEGDGTTGIKIEGVEKGDVLGKYLQSIFEPGADSPFIGMFEGLIAAKFNNPFAQRMGLPVERTKPSMTVDEGMSIFVSLAAANPYIFSGAPNKAALDLTEKLNDKSLSLDEFKQTYMSAKYILHELGGIKRTKYGQMDEDITNTINRLENAMTGAALRTAFSIDHNASDLLYRYKLYGHPLKHYLSSSSGMSERQQLVAFTRSIMPDGEWKNIHIKQDTDGGSVTIDLGDPKSVYERVKYIYNSVDKILKLTDELSGYDGIVGQTIKYTKGSKAMMDMVDDLPQNLEGVPMTSDGMTELMKLMMSNEGGRITPFAGILKLVGQLSNNI